MNYYLIFIGASWLALALRLLFRSDSGIEGIFAAAWVGVSAMMLAKGWKK